MKHVFISLASAFLCVDCDHIGSSSRQCPACASGAILSLANILNRCDDPTASPERVQRALAAMEAGLKA